jgi:predicted amidohydrolase
MSTFTVALLQMNAHGVDQHANLSKGERACREAARMGADLALFPEMWSIGYTFCGSDDPEAVAAWQERAIGQDSRFFTTFRALAWELNMAIGLTYLEKWDGPPRNSVSIIDRKGQVRMTYAKVHTCVFDFESVLTPGDGFQVCELETEAGPVRLGAMICYDREFPESARILMLRGAEIILVPNSCSLGLQRLGQFRARSYENLVGLAMTNYPAPHANGHSVAHDGQAYDREGRERDSLIVEAGEEEGIYLAAFDLDRLREHRRRETRGDDFPRRPEMYGPIAAQGLPDPFLPPDA